MSDHAIQRLINTRWPAKTAETVRYLRPGGSLTATGASSLDPWPDTEAGLERALAFMAAFSMNAPVALDITGCNIAGGQLLQMGGEMLGGIDNGFDFTATGPDNFFSRAQCQIRAEPELVVDNIAITGSSFEPTTGLLTLTVSNVLVANAHIGQFLIGDGLGEYATIWANTANTISLCTTTDVAATWTLHKAIYTYGGSLTFGDASDFGNGPMHLLALCDWWFSGIKFASTADYAASAIYVWPYAPVYFQLCDLVGLYLVAGGETVYCDSTYIHDAYIGHDGGAMTLRTSLIKNVLPSLHGSGGKGRLTNMVQSVFDGLFDPWGSTSPGNSYNWSAENSMFINGDKQGCAFGHGSGRISNCLVDNNGGVGVLLAEGAIVTMTNVDGTNGGAYGVQLSDGAQLINSGGNAVTGATNDLDVGDAGAFAWSDVPIVDLGQLCRVSGGGT